jgi:hypothetical protein
VRNDVAGMLQQQRWYLEGLVLKFQADAVFAQLARPQVHFEGTETHPGGLGRRFREFYKRGANLSPIIAKVAARAVCVQRALIQ